MTSNTVPIIQFLKATGQYEVEILDPESQKKISNMIFKNELFQPTSMVEYYYRGMYSIDCIMGPHYLITAAETGCAVAFFKLAVFYDRKNKFADADECYSKAMALDTDPRFSQSYIFSQEKRRRIEMENSSDSAKSSNIECESV